MVAPGEGIMVANYPSGWTTGSGTSFAAPLVSGAAALVWQDAAQKGVILTPQDTRAILLSTAQDLGEPGVDGVYGWGLLRVDQALAPVGLKFAAFSGQIVTDRFGRRYVSAPVPAITSDWSLMTLGESTKADHGALSITTRQAIREDDSGLAMVGVAHSLGELSFGLTAGAMHESHTFLGNLYGEPSITRLGGVEASWRGFGAFYMRGEGHGFPVDVYGVQASYGPFSASLAKPPTVVGEHAWVSTLRYRIRF